jgi:uncharacterized membrane protein YqaE (UPF0057 family)
MSSVNYGENCKKDSDCVSGICEYTGNLNERKCIQTPEKQYGEKCFYNADCTSNRCVSTFDENGKYIDKKCLVIDGQASIDDIPDRAIGSANVFSDTEQTPEERAETERGLGILTMSQKKREFQNRGPLVDIIVLMVEFVIVILRDIFGGFLMAIFKFWLAFWSLLFSAFNWKIVTAFGDRYKTNGKCNNDAYTISNKNMYRFITILFPPLGVFFLKGLRGFGQVIITFMLTCLFYVPGLSYGLGLIEDYVDANSICIYQNKGFNGEKHILSYGDYNIDDSEKLRAFKNCSKKGWGSTYNYSNIQSMKVGSNVNVVLYYNSDFTEEIATITSDTADILSVIPNKYKHRGCNTGIKGKQDVPKIGSLSIVLTEPLPIEPEQVPDNKIACYLLNDFRGKYVLIGEGEYTSQNLTSMFNDRISSIRVGRNVRVRLYEDDNFNKTSIFTANNKGLDISTSGSSKLLEHGEYKNLKKENMWNKISSMKVQRA